MHLIDIAGKGKDQRRKSKVFLDKPSFLKRIRRSIVARINIRFLKIYDSVREHQPRVSYFPTISFGSIDLESRIPLFYNSVQEYQIRSLVFFYDSVREHQLGVSYFPTILFGSVNSESRISLSFPTIPFGSINLESRMFRSFSTILFGSVNPESRIFLTIPLEKCDNL